MPAMHQLSPSARRKIASSIVSMLERIDRLEARLKDTEDAGLIEILDQAWFALDAAAGRLQAPSP